MKPAPEQGFLYPQLNEKKRELLEENGREIERRLEALEKLSTTGSGLGY